MVQGAEEELRNPLSDPESNDLSGFQNSDCKRIKISSYSNQQEEDVSSSGQTSSLGLTLRKTPSFVNLVEMKLSKAKSKSTHHASSRDGLRAKTDDSESQSISEKLKASNFPALLLKIGSWERFSRHEGDLVAKCYYAKKKIVWEVLEGALKSKIEIQWSDIQAIRATISDDQPGILTIELSQPPQFFRETNPQPRRHTLWHPAADFTGGQAPIYRRHYVKFPPGTLDRHYEKLLQCDPRLFELSKRPLPPLESPYFYSDLFGGTNISFGLRPHQPRVPPPGMQYSFSGIPSLVVPPRLVQDLRQTVGQTIGIVDSNSPMSVMDFPQRYENVHCHRTGQWGPVQGNNSEVFFPMEDPIQGLQPPYVVTSATQDGTTAFSYHAPADGGEDMRPDPNAQVLSNIANHLLCDSPTACSDEGELLEPVQESNFSHPLGYEQENFVHDNSIPGTSDHFDICGGLPCLQPIRLLPPHVSDGNFVHENSMPGTGERFDIGGGLPCQQPMWSLPPQVSEDFVHENSMPGTSERFHIGGGRPCPQPIRSLPPQVSDGNFVHKNSKPETSGSFDIGGGLPCPQLIRSLSPQVSDGNFGMNQLPTAHYRYGFHYPNVDDYEVVDAGNEDRQPQ